MPEYLKKTVSFRYRWLILRSEIKNELIRQNKLKREHKQCPVCGKKFEVNKSHLVYCSAECREVATKDKKKKYFKNYYSENRDKIIENNSINQKKKAGKI